ncbi:MAG TPA: hypothetical protein VGU44_05695, partial [Gammaproteobacteria bacterium]|nr:hypothetical protein [Gammaproteobacteria bacterium]
KRAGRAVKTKAGEAYTKVKGKVAGALSAETKATLESASNTVSSGFSAVSHAVSNVVSSVPSIPPVAPVLPALKDAAKNLQATISQHDAGITQSLRDLEALRFPKPQLIVNVPKTPPPPRPKNPTAEGIRKKRQGPRSSSQSEY